MRLGIVVFGGVDESCEEPGQIERLPRGGVDGVGGVGGSGGGGVGGGDGGGGGGVGGGGGPGGRHATPLLAVSVPIRDGLHGREHRLPQPLHDEIESAPLIVGVAARAGGDGEQHLPLLTVAHRVGYRVLDSANPPADNEAHAVRDLVGKLAGQREVDRGDAARSLFHGAEAGGQVVGSEVVAEPFGGFRRKQVGGHGLKVTMKEGEWRPSTWTATAAAASPDPTRRGPARRARGPRRGRTRRSPPRSSRSPPRTPPAATRSAFTARPPRRRTPSRSRPASRRPSRTR